MMFFFNMTRCIGVFLLIVLTSTQTQAGDAIALESEPSELLVSTRSANNAFEPSLIPILLGLLLSEEEADSRPTSTLIVPLFDATTELQADTQEETASALITRFSDRPRTRHAREDQFQSYDHYVSFYFEHRSTSVEIIDEVAKGGDTITMNVRTIFPLNIVAAENRWWYTGVNTVAEYAGNDQMDFLGFDGTHYHYQKTDTWNRQFNRPMAIGDRLEFEISQFSDSSIPRGQINYYGTTYLYVVGQGLVPWYTENAGEFVAGRELFQEDSRKIPEEYWLGGDTTLHYQYTDEPNDHFLQMATNIGYDNGEDFLLGRRIHHSSFVDGVHDENPVNGVLDINVGLTGGHYINERCSSCHERNGSAPIAPIGESVILIRKLAVYCNLNLNQATAKVMCQLRHGRNCRTVCAHPITNSVKFNQQLFRRVLRHG